MPFQRRSILRLLPLVVACFGLVGCQAYQELRHQEKANISVTKKYNKEIAVLLKQKSELEMTRSRLTAELKEAKKAAQKIGKTPSRSRPPRIGGTTSNPNTASRSVSEIKSELQQTEQQIAATERTIAILSM